MSNEICRLLIMFHFALLSDDIILSILQYVILQDLSNIGTRCDIIKAFVCSSKKTLQIFRSHEDFVAIQELLKIMRVYIKAYDEKMSYHEEKSKSFEKWESDFKYKHNIPRPLYIDYGCYFITNKAVFHGWSYGLVSFNRDDIYKNRMKYSYQYRYQENGNATELSWYSNGVALGFSNRIEICIDEQLYDYDSFDSRILSDARDARDVLKGVNMYVLSRESEYQDFVDVHIILPGGSIFLDLMADYMISYIQNTTKYEIFVEKIPIIFNSEEKGYIRSGPYEEHPLENYRQCHFYRKNAADYDYSGPDYKYGHPNSYYNCDCPSCTNKQYRVVIDNKQEHFLDGREGTTKRIKFLPN